jgi:ribonuclease HI
VNFDLFRDVDDETSSRPNAAARKTATRKKPETAAQLVAIYADESCLGNGREGSNPGGAGGVVELIDPKSRELVRYDYWASEPATTNNRMALRSVIEAYGELARMDRPFRVVFTSDSKYIVEGMRSWVASWIKRGWKRKGGPIENLALWQRAVAAVSPFETQWNWVRGHNGQPQNEYANHLATRAAAEQSCSAGLVKSDFDAWSAAHGRKINGYRETAPFPEEQTFKPSPRTWTI